MAHLEFQWAPRVTGKAAAWASAPARALPELPAPQYVRCARPPHAHAGRQRTGRTAAAPGSAAARTDVGQRPLPAAEREQARRLAERYRLEFVDMDTFHLDNDLFRSIPADVMLRYGFVPHRRDGDALVIVVSDPTDLLMIDELSLGLAPIIVEEVYRTLATIRDQGTTLLIVEQHVRHALGIADDVIVLVKGEVSYSGPVSELGDLQSRILAGEASIEDS